MEKYQAQKQDPKEIIEKLARKLEVEKELRKEQEEKYNMVKKGNQEMSKDLTV